MTRRARVTENNTMISTFIAAVILAGPVAAGLTGPLQYRQPVPLPGDDRATVAEFGRRDQVMPELGGRPRTGKLGADDVLVLGVAIEQQAVRPHDMVAGQAAGMLRRHGVCIVPSSLRL